jgi:hypothetical protein
MNARVARDGDRRWLVLMKGH